MTGGQRPGFLAAVSPPLLPPVSPLPVVSSVSAVGLLPLAQPAGCSDGFEGRRLHGGCVPRGDVSAVAAGDACGDGRHYQAGAIAREPAHAHAMYIYIYRSLAGRSRYNWLLSGADYRRRSPL